MNFSKDCRAPILIPEVGARFNLGVSRAMWNNEKTVTN